MQKNDNKMPTTWQVARKIGRFEESRMIPSFDTKAMCKILASYCNKQNIFGTECPAGGHYLCPFMQEDFGKPCFDMTWKDWRDFFKEDDNHEMDK